MGVCYWDDENVLGLDLMMAAQFGKFIKATQLHAYTLTMSELYM